jgi:hypothetical protein
VLPFNEWGWALAIVRERPDVVWFGHSLHNSATNKFESKAPLRGQKALHRSTPNPFLNIDAFLP